MNNITSFYIAGLNYVPDENQAKITKDIALKLVAEPDNAYDNNAIKVLLHTGEHIGYCPKKITKEIHPYRLAQVPIFAIVANWTPELPSYKRCLVTVQSIEPLPKFIQEKDFEEYMNFINLDKLD